MSSDKNPKPKARAPRGFRDRSGAELLAERAMLATIRGVYESYGFEALETGAFEYTDALGKFLPDVDRPNEGVFSLKDDDGQWLSLRYDLTAPLARYVAEHFQTLPKPFRRFQTGTVWRNEKPGPGRFREFTQFDADTVGTNSPAADAELLMMLADTLEALGLKRGAYVVKMNNRKLLDGVLETAGVAPGDTVLRSVVLRAIDKVDRLGFDGVAALLGVGRKDESGDFTKGAGLSDVAIDRLLNFTGWSQDSGVLSEGADNGTTLSNMDIHVGGSVIGQQGLAELTAINDVISAGGYGDGRIVIDPSIVRGLDYYTGSVFEAQLTFPVTNDAGETVVFGSVAGGGRYDDLVARFTGQQVPATGISIGVSRLLTALRSRGLTGANETPLIVVLAMDKDAAPGFALARELRAAGLRAEAYVGTKKIPDQLKYADRRGAAVAVIEGGDERARGEVTLKNLKLGAALSQDKAIESRDEYLQARQAQVTVKRGDLVASVRAMLGG